MGPLSKEIPQIELRSIWEVIRLRWWIVPLCISIGVGLLFAQESDLQTTPNLVLVSRSYAPRNETARLAIFGIDSASIKEYPTFQDQLIKVRRIANSEIEKKFGKQINIVISKADPQVSLVTSQDNAGRPILTMRSASEPNYDLNCLAVDEKTCSQASDIVAKIIITGRVASIASGLQQVADDIQKVLSQSNSIQPELELQLNALKSVMQSLTGEIVLVNETVEAQNATVSSVKNSTYMFGAGLGFFVSILVILQLTYTDDKIRSRKRLESAIQTAPFLGEIHGKKLNVEAAQIAAAIISKLPVGQKGSVVLIPVGSTASGLEIMAGLQTAGILNHVNLSLGSDIETMSIENLLENSKFYVLVVKKHFSTSQQVTEVYEILQRSGNQILGALLVAE